MLLFAKHQDWDWIIQVVVPLVVVGIAIIKKILGSREEEPETQPRPRALPRARKEGQEKMSPRDIGQLLDEVLAERRVVESARPKPVVVPRGTEVVVVRPATRPQKATGRARPAPMARPVQEPPKRQASRVATEARPTAALLPSALAESLHHGVAQAAASPQSATAPRTVSQVQRPGRPAESLNLFALLQSPADFRRAVILSEVLGPPLSRRRRR